MFYMDESNGFSAKLKVVGVGGGGCNALNNMVDAGVLGSYVAGVTVQKLFQTGTASPEEILAIGSDPDLIYNPSTAEDIRSAIYLEIPILVSLSS